MLFKGIDREYRNSLFRASLLGIHLVATTFVGLAVGYYLDIWLGTHPWLKIVFLVLGIAAGFKNMFQEVQRMQRREKEQDAKKD
jgi:ATP synthase protein I